MNLWKFVWFCVIFFISIFVYDVNATCVLESNFGFTINCAFKKSGLFRVRNLGGVKAHFGLGFSVGDELGFAQSLSNLDPSRRRSVNVKNGVPPNAIGEVPASELPPSKSEKRGKQNRLVLRQPNPTQQTNVNTQANQNNLALMQAVLHNNQKKIQTNIHMAPIKNLQQVNLQQNIPKVTIARPLPMNIPPFKPLPPKDGAVNVIPMSTPNQHPETTAVQHASESKQNQISKMVSQLKTPYSTQFTPAFQPMPTSFIPTKASALTIIDAPNIKPKEPQYHSQGTVDTIPINSIKYTKTSSISNLVNDAQPVDEVGTQLYPIYTEPTKKIDDVNSIIGYDDEQTSYNKDDINEKIRAIAKAANISMDAVEAAIVLRQQQLLNQYANIPMPTVSTSTTELPIVVAPELIKVPPKRKTIPNTGKVMNAPREYYPIGYEKNFDDKFESKVELPETPFYCGDQKYFPGLYGDEHLGCMVFHVCALTDDGLVMKSFLCPESTLFDQTILKCNWWFYVDCKNSKNLYDTNMPVSKSYQLMKALTFFSNYKKGIQEETENKKSEDMDGLKEAIAMIKSQDENKSSTEGTITIVTARHPVVRIERISRENKTNTNNSTTERENERRFYNNLRKYNNSESTNRKRRIFTTKAPQYGNETDLSTEKAETVTRYPWSADKRKLEPTSTSEATSGGDSDVDSNNQSIYIVSPTPLELQEQQKELDTAESRVVTNISKVETVKVSSSFKVHST